MNQAMQAIVLTRFGGPDAFELRKVAVPAVATRQVRVRVHATAINPLDIDPPWFLWLFRTSRGAIAPA